MNSAGSSEFSYEDRYGVKASKGWKLPAAIIAVVGIVWVFWAGLFHATPEFRTTLISFSVVSNEEVSISETYDNAIEDFSNINNSWKCVKADSLENLHHISNSLESIDNTLKKIEAKMK
jgi:hypothetical protein